MHPPERCFRAGQNLIGHDIRILKLANVGQGNGELITAQPCDTICWAHQVYQALGKELQNPVTGGMAMSSLTALK